jgi:hypothetical protein
MVAPALKRISTVDGRAHLLMDFLVLSLIWRQFKYTSPLYQEVYVSLLLLIVPEVVVLSSAE